MASRSTNTEALLGISESAYVEIGTALKNAGYTHAFGHDYISMTGIRLKAVEGAEDDAPLTPYSCPPTLSTYIMQVDEVAYSVTATLHDRPREEAYFRGDDALTRAAQYAAAEYGDYLDPEDLMKVSTDGVIVHPVEAHPADSPPCVFLLHTIRGGKDPDDYWHVLSEDIRGKLDPEDPWKHLPEIENTPHTPGVLLGYVNERTARAWVDRHGYQLADEVMAAVGY